MRITVDIENDMLKAAQRITGLEDDSALVSSGLQALIERESARQLARLGGTQPQLKIIRRRRSRNKSG